MRKGLISDKLMSGSCLIRQLMILALMVLCSTGALAQNKVSGTVVDANGEAVIGASVVVKGTSTGTVTDLDGNFTIPNVPQNGSLVVSYVGYATQTVPVGGKSSINITLQEDRQLLDDVVVVGYGVQKKRDVTGALTRVGEKELNSKPVNNAFEALQGKAAGVDITTSERPGTVGSIAISGCDQSLLARVPFTWLTVYPFNRVVLRH